ncbi:hypothetical protein AXG93_1085s1020 [Marchantia polymorpha subsp. ruderalis]|uniref:Uncharacterized protein n=1 Tax=Marchantia polymorpha subsp. ruderalis TaxID=1480154 RepID=A0A176VZA9_MARPO|nr:hypothetical protein AXG93_1085s1020 [Marchantia polymorpha subsp. ruderalis]
MSITQGGVGTSGGASGSIIEGTCEVVGADTNSGAVSVASSSTSEEPTGIPSFSPIPEFFKRILDRELRRRVCDATLLSDASLTLAYVFALSEIELNIVEKRVMTSSFARDTITTSRVPQSTSQSRLFGGGSGGDRGAQTQQQMAARVFIC